MIEIAPLKAAPLNAAIAAFLNVSLDKLKREYDLTALRKAVARAIRAYQEEDRWNSPDTTNGKHATPTMTAASSAAPIIGKREKVGSLTSVAANAVARGATLMRNMRPAETIRRRSHLQDGTIKAEAAE